MSTDTPQPVAPKRRPRFQFHLRTLFVVLTAAAMACGYIAHEWRIVRERNAWEESHPLCYFVIWKPKHKHAAGVADPSLLRCWLGDYARPMMMTHIEADASAAKSLFPETEIVVWQEEGGP